jgi:hypothetical protein
MLPLNLVGKDVELLIGVDASPYLVGLEVDIKIVV